MLTCRVLGPTEISADAGTVELGGPQPRRLITALIAAEGRPVPDDRLADAVWGDRVPAQAVTSLQAYVSRLRRVLGADALPRESGGYRLRVDHLDAAQFAAALDRGRALLAEGRPGEAVRALDAALALWRGEPYADLLPSPEVVALRGRLEELHAVAADERLAARLATGDAPAAVAEAEAAVRDQPYRERRWELLITGLYRSGRQADALATLRRVRRLLADDLGVDPGPGLQRLERQLLAQDPALLLPARSARPVRPLSAFLGRETELAALDDLLSRHRLVTLVGPGGAGKTRLAVEHAAGRDDGDGPWLVRLADVTDPALLPSAVAAAMGVRALAGDPLPALAAAIADRAGLVVLDNCEHLVADAAEVALTLLAAGSRLRVLATSREPLGADGERTLPVPPLAPEAAVDLLTDRIGGIRPGWTPDAAERADLRHLATALDGIPLALELAAARARVLAVGELVTLLDHRFPALGAVPRGALAPHATLEAAIAWSVDLLSPGDRTLLLRLWPFEGGFPLEAVAAMGADLEALSSLVTRSVVAADMVAGPTRYRLLELVRAYCRGRDPDPAGSRAAHAVWVRDLVERSERDLRGERSAHTVRVLRRELPNLRAAIAHDLVAAPAAALRTVGLLDWFWFRGGHVDEGRRLLGAALAAAPHAPAVDRARAWASFGALRFSAGDLPGADAALKEFAAALGVPDDRPGRALQAQVRFYEALMWLSRGDAAVARDLAGESVAMGEEVGEEWIAATALMVLGAALVALGETDRGRTVLAEATTRSLRVGQLWTAAMTEFQLARSHVAAASALPPGERSADIAVALPLLRSALDRLRREDDLSDMLTVLLNAAWALALDGATDRARTLLTAVRRHARRRGLRPETTSPDAAAALAAVAGDGPDPAGEGLDEDAMIAVLDQR